MEAYDTLLIAGGAFVAMLLLMAAILPLVSAPMQRRAAAGATEGGRPSAGRNSALLAKLGTLARPEDPDEQAGLRAWLTQAGFSGRRTLERYLAARVILALVAPALVVTLAPPLRPLVLCGVGILSTGIGYYAPFALVSYRRSARQLLLRNAFPNALDMLVSCLEAGLGLDAALRYVATELRMAAPEFSGEVALVNAELTAGVSRVEALRHFHQRTDLEEIGALVNELAQAERYGSRIAAALRAHAQLTRQRRVLDGERRAAEATPKLTVMMILFILPPLFIVLLGPTVVNLVNRVLPTLVHR